MVGVMVSVTVLVGVTVGDSVIVDVGFGVFEGEVIGDGVGVGVLPSKKVQPAKIEKLIMIKHRMTLLFIFRDPISLACFSIFLATFSGQGLRKS